MSARKGAYTAGRRYGNRRRGCALVARDFAGSGPALDAVLPKAVSARHEATGADQAVRASVGKPLPEVRGAVRIPAEVQAGTLREPESMTELRRWRGERD